MNENKTNRQRVQFNKRTLLLALGLSLVLVPMSTATIAAEPTAIDHRLAVKVADAGVMELAPRINATVGKSALLKLPDATSRVSVGDKEIADIILINPKELYLLGKKVGTTNVMLWSKNGRSTVVDVNVGMDAQALQAKLQQIMPEEKKIAITNAADSLIITGSVFDAAKVDRVMMIAEAYAGKKVVNMLTVSSPQQVMLEVKMAEVSKTILDKLGAQFSTSWKNGGMAYAVASGFLSLASAPAAIAGGTGGAKITIRHNDSLIKIDAENKDELIKTLAEPNIMAISGQEGSFLAGGKIFIPVPQSSAAGNTITLEERDFGVGLRFTPTVLEGDLINLRVSPEVSELSSTGTTVSASGSSSVLPSFTIRRASTTVQLRDGQSFAIAGLIKSDNGASIRRFPILGEIPILGALFRSSEFKKDKTELLFVITPRLVKPLPPNYALPTDNYVAPTKKEFFIDGKLEGKPAQSSTSQSTTSESTKTQSTTTVPEAGQPEKAPAATAPAPQNDNSGFEMK